MKRILIFLLALIPLCVATAQVDDQLREKIEGIMKEFEGKKYDAVIEQVDATKAQGETAAFLQNIRGAALTKKKEYALAKEAFEKTLELQPGMFAANFNLGELMFLQKDYEGALAWFRNMLVGDPRNELLQFKVFLCHLEMDDEAGARKALETIRYPGDTPAWYYAQAAWEFSRGNKGRASDYLAGARYIFPGKTDIFDETFVDLGLPTR